MSGSSSTMSTRLAIASAAATSPVPSLAELEDPRPLVDAAPAGLGEHPDRRLAEWLLGKNERPPVNAEERVRAKILGGRDGLLGCRVRELHDARRFVRADRDRCE